MSQILEAILIAFFNWNFLHINVYFCSANSKESLPESVGVDFVNKIVSGVVSFSWVCQEPANGWRGPCLKSALSALNLEFLLVVGHVRGGTTIIRVHQSVKVRTFTQVLYLNLHISYFILTLC